MTKWKIWYKHSQAFYETAPCHSFFLHRVWCFTHQSGRLFKVRTSCHGRVDPELIFYWTIFIFHLFQPDPGFGLSLFDWSSCFLLTLNPLSPSLSAARIKFNSIWNCSSSLWSGFKDFLLLAFSCIFQMILVSGFVFHLLSSCWYSHSLLLHRITLLLLSLFLGKHALFCAFVTSLLLFSLFLEGWGWLMKHYIRWTISSGRGSLPLNGSSPKWSRPNEALKCCLYTSEE